MFSCYVQQKATIILPPPKTAQQFAVILLPPENITWLLSNAFWEWEMALTGEESIGTGVIFSPNTYVKKP